MKEQRLSIIRECEYITKSGRQMPGYLCKCVCGNTKIVSKSSFDSGKTRSCGCIIRDFNSERGRFYKSSSFNEVRMYGVDEKIIKKIRTSYKSMLSRCRDPHHVSYINYGGRGISVCDEWMKDKESFIKWALENGFEEGKSIDRIDVNGNYEPSNCRWATRAEQARNTRRNVYIAYNDDIYTITDLAKKLGVDVKCLSPLAKKGIKLRGEV